MSARFIFALLAAAFVNTAFAMSNDPPQVIVNIATGWGGEGAYIQAQNKPSLCSAGNYFIPSNAPMFKEIYAALLSAFQSNGKVILNYEGCESFGAGSLKSVVLVK